VNVVEVEMNGKLQGNPSDKHLVLSPKLFQHQCLLDSFESAKVISPKELINLINYIHFTDRHAFALLQHPVYDEYVLMKVYPEPCLDTELTCRWDENYLHYPLASYQLKQLVIPQDRSIIFSPLNILRRVNGTFTMQLPERSYALNERRSSRFVCYDVSAELVQSGMLAYGELTDFGPQAFRIHVRPEAGKIKSWFNVDASVTVRLFSGQETIFSGSCRCLRRQGNDPSEDLVLTVREDHVTRFQPKKIRNPRRQMMPPPLAVFEHPFFKKRIQRDIFDLATTGFSISDNSDEAVLMPGMIISKLSILHAGVMIANCTAQIIYRRVDGDTSHYGIAILDMDIHSYSRINHLLGAHADPHISVSTEIDMDALWEFFFQAGFIYPKKYGFCQAYREDYITTYRKLYQENPDIARHITYEKNGKIYGHMSMVRAYERTWLIQHHAAMPMENRMPGYVVLRHIILFLHGVYSLPSAKMDYVMCYFRPENKFPDRVFGGFARDLNNPQWCSLDLFSYLTVPTKGASASLPDGWLLREMSRLDLWELDNFYRRMSEGLFMNVLTKTVDLNEESLSEAADRRGLKRKWSFFALCHENRLVCVMIVNQSDLGINLSEILNSITLMVTEADLLSWDVLMSAVAQLAAVYDIDKVPLLIYPETFVQLKGIPFEKRYQMWIIDMHYSNLFLEFVQKKFRMKYE
jgi:hypothetical protein